MKERKFGNDASSKLYRSESNLPLAIALPALPSLVRYTDIFEEKEVILRDLESDNWVISDRGRLATIDFTLVDEDIRHMLKLLGYEFLTMFAPSSAVAVLSSLINIDPSTIRTIVYSKPGDIKIEWEIFRAKYININANWAMKSLLKLACKNNVLAWSPLYLDLIASLPSPKQDKWLSLRAGDVFLSVEEESQIIEYLDCGNRSANTNSDQVATSDLVDLALITSSYQFGLRPVQIGRLKINDISVRMIDGATTSVYVTYRGAKQRSSRQELPMIRKVKSEWGHVFIELLKRKKNSGAPGDSLFLGLSTAHLTSRRILKVLSSITNTDRTATDLRHTAAQRLVDSGASHEELAEFMGHSDLSSGLVYYDISVNQNERVNNALGLSETYKAVTKIAKAKFISSIELDKLKGIQQIGGVPHGILIAGIGGCEVGQPLCPSNPIMACYGCSKFMPLSDSGIHHKVLSDFRTVVSFYEQASRAESSSSAFLQLKRTIEAVKGVIAELEGN